MNIEEIRNYCLAKPGCTEGFPFGPSALVFKVAGKMFALLNLEEKRLNLKCPPAEAVKLRETFAGVIPGYHMNKKHWNTIILEENIPGDKLLLWINTSYQLVYDALPKREKEKLKHE